MTTSDPREWLTELTDHLTDMADSLDDHVTPEDVHRLLMEARQLSLQRDAALTAVLDQADAMDGIATEPVSDDVRSAMQLCARGIRRAITEHLGGNRG